MTFNRRDFYITARNASKSRLNGQCDVALREDRELERMYRLAKQDGLSEDDLVDLEEKAREEGAAEWRNGFTNI